MGMAAILVMWPGPFEQTFIPHPMEAPNEIWLIGQAISEEKIFKECERRRTTTDGQRTQPILYAHLWT